ncbi:MAG: cell division protein [Caulobacteraceae bacterium]
MRALAFLFQKRIRGFRVAELAAFFCLTALVFGVYFSKAHAGGETAKIGDVDQQITEEQRRVRLLNAELAHLEEPARIERLSEQYLGLAPIDAKRETSATNLMEIARQAGEPASAKVVKVSVPTPPTVPQPPRPAQLASAALPSEGVGR